WRELLTFTIAWPVWPGASVTVPNDMSLESGKNGCTKYWNVEAGQLGPLASVMARSNGTLAPATCGSVIAGVSATTGGWRMQVRSLITAAGAASVFSQTEST